MMSAMDDPSAKTRPPHALPQPLADAIDAVAAPILKNAPTKGHRIWRFWDQAVGGRIAQYSEPAKLNARTLTIRVAGAAWMTQLSFLKGELIAKLNGFLGAEIITEIRFIQGPLLKHQVIPPKKKKPPLPPPTPEEEARATALVAEIKDTALRRILYRFALHGMIRNRSEENKT